MRSNQYLIALPLLTFIFFVSGCGSIVKNLGSSSSTVAVEERNFAFALQNLRDGNEFAARELFERVVDARPRVGVTDEAIFRLALLHLRDEGGKGEPRARTLLNRLITEFPSSIWARQASPLVAYLQEAFSLRTKQRELRDLRNQNLSLSRDNKELRQSIERLKQLDLELEQKIRR